MDDRQFNNTLEDLLKAKRCSDYRLPAYGTKKQFLIELVMGDRWSFRRSMRARNQTANDPAEMPSDVVNKRLCDLFVESSPTRRDHIWTSISSQQGYCLLHFAWRKSVAAINNRSTDDLRYAVVALCIADHVVTDNRDIYCYAILCVHAARKLEWDIRAALCELEVEWSNQTPRIFDELPNREPRFLALSSWSYCERQIDGRTVIERVPPSIPS